MSIITKKLGSDFSSKVSFSIEQNKVSGKYVAYLSIGEEYYETEPWDDKQDAKDELLGYIEALQKKLSITVKDLEKK